MSGLELTRRGFVAGAAVMGAAAFAAGAAGCASGAKDGGDGKAAATAADLPMEISQEDWDESRRFVTLPTGIQMSYVEMGNPDGEALVLQHGMTDNSRSWSLAAPYFTAAGYHVYLPDLRGMGKTDEPDGYYTLATYAADLKAFFDAVDIEKAIFVGHSLGSFVAQTFALNFPERVKKLVLVSSIPMHGYQNATLLGAYAKYVQPLADDGHPSDAFMDVWYACEPAEDGIRDVFDAFLGNMKTEAQRLSKKSWTNIFLGLVASSLEGMYTLFDHDIPVLVLHGDDDTMTLTQYQAELCELLGVGEDGYRNYAGIGHNIQFVIPERCSADILGWLSDGKLPAQ